MCELKYVQSKQWGLNLDVTETPMNDDERGVLLSLLGFDGIENVRDSSSGNKLSDVFFSKVLNSRLPKKGNNTVLMELLCFKPNANVSFVDTLLSIPGIDTNMKNSDGKKITDIISDKMNDDSKLGRGRRKRELIKHWKNLGEKIDTYEERKQQINAIVNHKLLDDSSSGTSQLDLDADEKVFESIYQNYTKWYESKHYDENESVNSNVVHTSNSNYTHMFRTWYVEGNYNDALIGEGAFSKVYKAIDFNYLNSNEKNVYVAIKLIQRKLDGTNDESASKWLASNEIRCLKKIDHENVVKILAYDTNVIHEDEAMIGCVLEYANNGNLHNLISKLAPLSDVLARTYFKQILTGINACHKMGIINRDIKPRNIVLDVEYNAKLCDFGFAKVT